MDFSTFKNKYILTGKVIVMNALHIGSGKEKYDRDASFITQDDENNFYIPGSSFRGYLRTKLERFLDMDNNFGLIDKNSGEELNEGDVSLIFGYTNLDKLKIEESKDKKNRVVKIQERIAKKLNIEIEKISSVKSMAGRIHVYDMPILNEVEVITRDGIKIDRDTGATEKKAKFDYDVVPMGSEFELRIELENVEQYQLDLIGLSLRDIISDFGDLIGGKTARGIGRCRVIDLRLQYIDTQEKNENLETQVKDYIFKNIMKKKCVDEIFELKNLSLNYKGVKESE